MIFELAILVLVGVFLLILYKLDSKIIKKFLIACVAVLLFEYFTQALWINLKLQKWAYLYLDVSWILTIGWAGIIVVSMNLVELYLPKMKEYLKYIISLVIISLVGILAEWVVLYLEIRKYTPVVQESLSGITVGYGLLPIEIFYYIPVFMALVTSFVRYWEINLDEKKNINVKPTKKKSRRKSKK